MARRHHSRMKQADRAEAAKNLQNYLLDLKLKFAS